MNHSPSQIVLRPGMRFALRNQTFEIAHVDANTLRYVSCMGGRSKTMPTALFWSSVDEEIIGFIDGAANTDSNGNFVWQLSESEREEAHRRLNYVRAALERTRKPTGRKHLQNMISAVSLEKGDTSPPSAPTLARWIRNYKAGNGSLASLVPRDASKGRMPQKFSMEMEMLIREKLLADYLTRERLPFEQVRCNIIAEKLKSPWMKDDRLPSRSTLYRRAEQLDKYVVTHKRYGKKIADAIHAAAGASLEFSRPMQCVMIDGHRLDVMVVCKKTGEVLGRPFLTCLFDVATRCVVGWHLSLLPFCATTAMAAIKHMCSRDPNVGPGGVPEMLVPDNGADLASAALRNLCRYIHLNICPAKKYSPNDKAHLERFFRTLTSMLTHRLPGTTFSSPDDRADYESTNRACLTLEDLGELFEKDFLKAYHTRIHSATKRAPLLAWQDSQQTFPILHYSIIELDIAARVPHPRTINKGRILIDGLYYKSNALRALELRGKKDVVALVDELNLGSIFVHDPLDHKLLYEADAVREDYANGLTKYEHDEVRARLKEATEEDLKQLGDYAYEITRHELWDDIQKRKVAGLRRKLKNLRALAASSQIVVPTPEFPGLKAPEAEHRALPPQEVSRPDDPQGDCSRGAPVSTASNFEVFVL